MLDISDTVGGEMADDADATIRQLGIPDSTARSRLHYALQALRRQLVDRDAIGSR